VWDHARGNAVVRRIIMNDLKNVWLERIAHNEHGRRIFYIDINGVRGYNLDGTKMSSEEFIETLRKRFLELRNDRNNRIYN
jgi:hypothetical protein